MSLMLKKSELVSARRSTQWAFCRGRLRFAARHDPRASHCVVIMKSGMWVRTRCWPGSSTPAGGHTTSCSRFAGTLMFACPKKACISG